MSERLLSKKELAAYLGMSVSWIDKQVAARTIPFYKLGRVVKFRLSEIELFLDERSNNEV